MSWPNDSSDNDSGSCDGIDCDHHVGSSTGLVFASGRYFASFGWGVDDGRRLLGSEDGVSWNVVMQDHDFDIAGITYGKGVLVLGDPYPRRSLDLGDNFTQSDFPPYDVPNGAWPNSRAVGFSRLDEGRFGLIAADGDGAWSDIIVSDDGDTWTHPQVFPDECTGYRPQLVYGNGVWLQVWYRGVSCRSTDNGETWEYNSMGDDLGEFGTALWNGSEFVVYNGTRGLRSTDGKTWTEFTSSHDIRVVAYNPHTGTYAAVNGDYDQQVFMRSQDGVTWTVLGSSAFTKSHPITHMILGYTQACPD